MKALVVYYSRTGNAKKVGDAIAKAIGADVEELADGKKRGGPIGWLGAGRDGMKGRTTEIAVPAREASAYDLVIIGTPVWGGGISAATRTYIERFKESLPEVALFATCGGGAGKAMDEMEKLIGKRPRARLEVRDKEIDSGEMVRKVRGFAEAIGG